MSDPEGRREEDRPDPQGHGTVTIDRSNRAEDVRGVAAIGGCPRRPACMFTADGDFTDPLGGSGRFQRGGRLSPPPNREFFRQRSGPRTASEDRNSEPGRETPSGRAVSSSLGMRTASEWPWSVWKPLSIDSLPTPLYRSSVRRRSALTITETELKVIAALASIGLSRSPKAG